MKPSPSMLLRAAGALLTAGVLLGSAVLPASAANFTASMTEPQEGRYAFTPGSMTVPVGSVITWTNQTDAPHTVTADGGAFNSPRLNQNQTFSFTFNTPGTFAFHCAVHPYMTGTVVVNAANSAPASAAAAASASSPASPVASRVASAATTSSTGAAVPSAAPKTGAGGGASSSIGIPMGFTAGVLILLVAGSGGALAFAIRRSRR